MVWEGDVALPRKGDFFELSCTKIALFCTLNVIIRGEGYVKWHIPVPYFPIYFFLTPIKGGGGGGMGPYTP